MNNKNKNDQPITRGLASGGALSRGTLCRNLGVRHPSEPYRYPSPVAKLLKRCRQFWTIAHWESETLKKILEIIGEKL